MNFNMSQKSPIDIGLVTLATNDSVMASLIKELPKFSPKESPAPFYDLIRSIISQQLSVKAAKTIYDRYLDLMGHPYHADHLDRMDIEKLRAVGLSYRKSSYIKNVAAKVIEKEDYFLLLERSSDEEILKELTSIKGVGVWTAQMFLMFTLGRLDVLPLGDVGIQNAVQKFYQLQAKPSPEQLQKIAANWTPYRTIGCWYLWQALDAKPA